MTTVAEIMNKEVYAVRTDELVGEVLGMILTLGITAAPVVDEEGVALGLVSLRNLARASREDSVDKHMTTPPATISPSAEAEQAGREMGQLAYHHLVVVDASDKVVGFVSSLDVIRGLVGLPAAHPPAFPNQEPESGLSWSPNLPLDAEHIAKLRGGPGMLVLTHAGNPDEVLWAEANADVPARLRSLLEGDHGLPEQVRTRLEQGSLAFRAAAFGPSGDEGGGPSVIDVLLPRRSQ
ncbi:CBS domain-containing protein [Pseudenhygromyxa sp. WMMC2535]|uniref:CBS domain-containing protein n=1 Tax=Pseudenhygromyxa sp. WMMC2535 TaxID=2712867 RepID=UPI0015556B79|nr:CBS domain-containing protein [Pseudenhygromyxa sp. WMMC2535]NVB38073.1 CBS domain-containing protein [Pseudenhygromyxa sp. WMMC2535]